MAWEVDWKVSVSGFDQTSKMQGILNNISATDKEGQVSDTCNLSLDDTGGQIRLFPPGESLEVSMDGVRVFAGVISNVRSTGRRQGGRLLQVNGKGFDDRGKVKEPQRFHMDDTPLSSFLGKAAELAGLSGITVDPQLASIVRNYWAADAESFLHLGERLARELHATFKIRQDRAVLVPKGKDFGLPAITGRVDVEDSNVISWSISPSQGRSDFTEVEARYFDRQTGKIEILKEALSNDRGLPEAVNRIRAPVMDKDQAEELIKARKGEADNQAGSGSVTLDITPEAQAEGTFVLTGARPGIDGTYRIAGRTHDANRGGGSTTKLDLKKPTGGAGRDERS